MLPDTHSEPLLGPGLTIGGHLLKWEGPPKPDLESSLTALEPIDLRVTFESGVEEMTTSHIAMENSGTTALYYSWKVHICTCSLFFNFIHISEHGSTLYYRDCYIHNRAIVFCVFLQLMPQPNPLQTVQAGDTQRFYFDVRGGLCTICTSFSISLVCIHVPCAISAHVPGSYTCTCR